MTMVDETQLAASGGVIGICAYFLTKAITSIMEKLKNGTETKSTVTIEQWNALENKINTLYDMHHKFDQDGSPVWYTKRELYQKLEKIEGHMSMQAQLINGLIDKVSKGK